MGGFFGIDKVETLRRILPGKNIDIISNVNDIAAIAIGSAVISVQISIFRSDIVY